MLNKALDVVHTTVATNATLKSEEHACICETLGHG